ncbi:MAG: HDOD domain-containing protein [Bacteroidetes bacterium]|nr:HDOD domain-containing protein [Bacteroidota bacterium]
MLSNKIRRKLENLKELPSIPSVISNVLNEIDAPDYSAKYIAKLIEQDQGLTARILKMANSPYYGLVRTISTIDTAIIILGSNTIKEILLSLLMQKIFTKTRSKLLNTKSFWQYSIFCGAASRFIARKMKYKIVSEAFVTGLMHDIGILVAMDNFRNNFSKVRKLQTEEGYSIIEAELEVLECTHSDIGAWITEKWNFPEKISNALKFHHTPFYVADEEYYSDDFISNPTFNKLKYPLATITSISEWFAFECGMKNWDTNNEPTYYATNEFIMNMVDDELLDYDSALVVLKQGIMDEYEKCSVNF